MERLLLGEAYFLDLVGDGGDFRSATFGSENGDECLGPFGVRFFGVDIDIDAIMDAARSESFEPGIEFRAALAEIRIGAVPER